MWLALLFTVLGASGNNIGKILQKQATVTLPRLGLNKKIIYTYISNRLWMSGLVIDISGAFFMIFAVIQAPVSIVQPVSGCGLAILAVFSHFYLHESMHIRDWIGVVLASMGTIAVGITGEEDDGKNKIDLLRYFIFVFLFFLLMGVFEGATLYVKAKRIEAEASSPISPFNAGISDVKEEIFSGSQAGICFGLSAAACKTGFQFSSIGIGFTKFFAPMGGILFSVLLSTTGFFYQNRGFKEGRAVVVSTCASVSSILTGVLVGMFALGESLPSKPPMKILRFVGWGLIMLGIVVLVVSEKGLLTKSKSSKLSVNQRTLKHSASNLKFSFFRFLSKHDA